MTLIQNEHGYWEVRIRGRNGRIRSFSTRRKSKREALKVIADAKLKEIEMAAEAAILSPEVYATLTTGTRNRVCDAIEPWQEWLRYDHQSENTIKANEQWIKSWIKTANTEKRPIASITRRDIDVWINDPELKTKHSTRKAMLSAVRSFFKFCCANGWSQGNPASLIRIDLSQMSHSQKETNVRLLFEDGEIEELLKMTAPDGQKPSGFWNAAIAIARWTGLRLVDICCLEWDCFSTPGKLACWTRKRDNRVLLDIQPEALQKAIDQVEDVDPVYLFPTQREIALNPTRRQGLSVQFLRLCREAGIWGKSFHCLRHTLASRLAETGTNLEKIKEILGHTDLETTRGYVHLVDD